MALSLSQGAQMVANVGYQNRIRAAMVRHAVTVMGEAIGAMTQTVFNKRKVLAARILNNPDAYLSSFLAVVAADPGASLTWFNPVSVTSSTNANPSVVTTASAHGLAVGDVVEIVGHTTNTNINGVWTLATVGSSTTFTVPYPANGAGSGGFAMEMETDVNLNFTIQNNFSAIAGTYTGETG